MTKIYLIRHAEAEGNLYRIAHGQEEGLITDYRGPRQMQALAQQTLAEPDLSGFQEMEAGLRQLEESFSETNQA